MNRQLNILLFYLIRLYFFLGGGAEGGYIWRSFMLLGGKNKCTLHSVTESTQTEIQQLFSSHNQFTLEFQRALSL